MNIGEALIEILADAGDFAKDASKQLSGPLKTVGKTTADAFSATFQIGMAAAAGLATAAITKTISGGLKRLEGIDTAEARLRGIGVVGEELAGVMDQVRDSVRGTSISLDGAAQAAALMMTSGVREGKPLEATLDALTNAAAATGKEIEEITPLWQEMAVQGDATSNVVRRLGDMGVNALAALADEFGVTQEEADKMVKSGKVSFEEFNQAITGQLGDMAEAVGNSFKGMKDNTNAAFAMIGAAGLAPFKDAFTTAMPDILNFMYDLSDAIADAAKPLNDKLIPAAEKLGDYFKGLDASKSLQGITDGLKSIDGLLGPLVGLALGSLGPLLARIPLLGQAFTKLTGPVGLVIGLFVEMFRNSEPLRDAMSGLFDMLSGAASSVGPVFEALAGLVGELAGTLGDVLGGVILELLPVVEDLLAVLGPALVAILQAVQPLIEKLGGALGKILVKAIEKLVPPLLKIIETLLPPLITLFEVVIDVVGWIIDALGPLIDLLMNILGPALAIQAEILSIVVGWLTDLFTSTEEGASIWSEAWNWILEVIDTFTAWFQEHVAPIIEEVWGRIQDAAQAVAAWYQETLAPLFEAVGEFLGVVFENVSEAASTLWGLVKGYFEKISETWDKAWTEIQKVWDKVGPPLMEFIEGSINTLKSVWDIVWNSIKKIFEIVWNTIKTVVDTAINTIKNIINTVTALIKGDWEGVWNGIKDFFNDLWEGLLRGVGESLDSIWEWIVGLKDDVLNFFANAGSWLFNAGKSILQGLWDGMKNIWNDLTGWVGDLGGWIADLKGPEEYDKKLLIPQGKWIMEGLGEGAKAGWRDVEKFFKKIGPSIDINPTQVAALEPSSTRLEEPGVTSAEIPEEQIQVLARAIYEAVRAGFGNGVSSFFDASEMGA